MPPPEYPVAIACCICVPCIAPCYGTVGARCITNRSCDEHHYYDCCHRIADAYTGSAYLCAIAAAYAIDLEYAQLGQTVISCLRPFHEQQLAQLL